MAKKRKRMRSMAIGRWVLCEPLLCRASRCEMSACRSGEAGGEREAAAGERSLHEIEACDVGGGRIVRVGMGLGRRVQHAARSVICGRCSVLCAVLLAQRVQHTGTSVDCTARR